MEGNSRIYSKQHRGCLIAADMRRYLATSAVTIQAEGPAGKGRVNAVVSYLLEAGGDVTGSTAERPGCRQDIQVQQLNENVFVLVKLCNRFILVLLAEVQGQH